MTIHIDKLNTSSLIKGPWRPIQWCEATNVIRLEKIASKGPTQMFCLSVAHHDVLQWLPCNFILKSLVPLANGTNSISFFKRQNVITSWHMTEHSRIFGRLDVFTYTCGNSYMFRYTNLKVTFGFFTIINNIAATTIKHVPK